jgi:hypothetical protein
VAIYDFGGKTLVSETRNLKTAPFHPSIKSMWFFYGSEGIIADTHLFDLNGNLVRPFEAKSENHFANFLRAVRSRKHTDLAADILEGHQSSALCHIANISYRTGALASPEDIRAKLGSLGVQDDVKATFDKTLEHLIAAGVDPKTEKLRLGQHLFLDPQKESFSENATANSFLTRQYRAPFALPSV